MKDDYLWDKSGQPDPEIQQLEEILGTLRYQPKPLALPVVRRRSYFPLLAIAATLLLALLATGIWIRVRMQSAPEQKEAKVNSTPAKVDEKKPEPITATGDDKSATPQEQIAVNHKHRHRPPTAPALSKAEREEALIAKEQLMMALRLTTEKLSLVHRKTQNTTPANQIKNQHRVG
jgi:cytoskeletal protein RodZ